MLSLYLDRISILFNNRAVLDQSIKPSSRLLISEPIHILGREQSTTACATNLVPVLTNNLGRIKEEQSEIGLAWN